MITEVLENYPTETQIAEAQTRGIGRNVFIADWQRRNTPAPDLSKPEADALVGLEEAQAKLAAAEAEWAGARRLKQQQVEMVNRPVELRVEVQQGIVNLEQYKAESARCIAKLEAWTRLSQVELANTITSLVNMDWFMAFLPGWIERRKSALEAAEKALAEFERANNFVTEGPGRPLA
jgi:hypothetical protein